MRGLGGAVTVSCRMCNRTDRQAEAVSAQERRREILLRMRMLRKQPEEPPPEPDIPFDFLAVITSHQRRLVEDLYRKVDELKRRHPSLNVLFRSTQPAHLVMVLTVLFICSILGRSTSATTTSSWTSLVYLAASSVHVGNQFWMTFVSGLALYFNLPRHDFGAVQKVLFPKYFSINSFLSLVTLISFTKLYNTANMNSMQILQLAALSLCLLLELTIRLYVVPPVIRLITEKTKLEVAAGVGREVGHFSPGQLLLCPFYKRKHLTFRRLHVVVAVGNILTMACTSLHLYYLAQCWVCHLD